jgi:PAS domain S-box-containing protein
MGPSLDQGRGTGRGLGSLQPKTLLESIPDFAVIFDSDGKPVAANTAALRMLSTTPAQLSRMSQANFLNLLQAMEGEQAIEPAGSIVTRALGGESIHHKKRRIRRPDSATTTDLSVSASPICNDQGHAVGVLMLAQDLTELSTLQRRVEDAERHNAIGQMTAAMAHDFSNVLDTIGQAGAVLEASKNARERRDMIRIIRTAVRRGSEIIAAVREYLRTGTGETAPVDIRQVLIETIELTRPLWQRAGIHLSTQLQAVQMVMADIGDLRRVFTNLIINAIEAMPSGGELAITCSESNQKVLASITDTGVGIAAEDQGKIFFPYFTTKTQGTGLGLSGAQKTLVRLGGSVRFSSIPGKNTTFTVELPVQQKKQDGNQHQSAA